MARGAGHCSSGCSLKSCQALILALTRELAQQIHKFVLALGEYLNVRCHACFGGTSVRDDIDKFQDGLHIVVGTPGRVFEMLSKRHLRIDDLLTFVCDEADEMLSRGFKDHIYDIFKILSPNVQDCLFSATMADTSDLRCRCLPRCRTRLRFTSSISCAQDVLCRGRLDTGTISHAHQHFGIAIWISPEILHEGAPHAIDIRQIALKTLFVEEGMLHGEFRMHTNTSNLRSTVLSLGGWCLLDLAFLEYDLDHIRPSGTFPMPCAFTTTGKREMARDLKQICLLTTFQFVYALPPPRNARWRAMSGRYVSSQLSRLSTPLPPPGDLRVPVSTIITVSV